MGNAGESLFQGKEAELSHNPDPRGTQTSCSSPGNTGEDAKPACMRTPRFDVGRFFQQPTAWVYGFKKRTEVTVHPPPTPIMEVLELSLLYVVLPSDSPLTVSLCRGGPQGSLR